MKKAAKRMPLSIRGRLLSFFGPEAVSRLDDFGLHVVVLKEGQKYSDVSAVNAADPFENDELVRGVYMPQERTIYLRNTSDGTVVHEVAHALDHAAGRKIESKAMMTAFETAPAFISNYAKTSCAEWFAENVRAIKGALNGDYDDVSPEKLAAIDPRGYALTLKALNRITKASLPLPLAA
jgi:hypothetical protein